MELTKQQIDRLAEIWYSILDDEELEPEDEITLTQVIEGYNMQNEIKINTTNKYYLNEYSFSVFVEDEYDIYDMDKTMVIEKSLFGDNKKYFFKEENKIKESMKNIIEYVFELRD